MMLPPILDDEWDVCPTATPKRAARPAADPYPTEPRNADGGMLLPLILNDEWEDAPAESVAEPDAADEELLLPPIGDELDAETPGETPTLTPTAQELAPIESAESESQATENLSLDLPALDLPPFDPATYEDADAESLFISQTLIRSLDASPVTPSGEEYLPLRSERIMTWLRLWGFVRDYSLGTAPTQSLCVKDGGVDRETDFAGRLLALQAFADERYFSSSDEEVASRALSLLSEFEEGFSALTTPATYSLLSEALRYAPFMTRAVEFERLRAQETGLISEQLRKLEDFLGLGHFVSPKPEPEIPDEESVESDAPNAPEKDGDGWDADEEDDSYRDINDDDSDDDEPDWDPDEDNYALSPEDAHVPIAAENPIQLPLFPMEPCLLDFARNSEATESEETELFEIEPTETEPKEAGATEFALHVFGTDETESLETESESESADAAVDASEDADAEPEQFFELVAEPVAEPVAELTASEIAARVRRYYRTGLKAAYTANDDRKAARYFLRGAREGVEKLREFSGEERRAICRSTAPALRELGLCRLFGAGCRQNSALAWRLLRRAAKFGDVQARMKTLELAISQDSDVREWALAKLEKRAESGNFRAKTLLARFRAGADSDRK